MIFLTFSIYNNLVRGCINDVKNMQNYINTHQGYSPQNQRILIDDDPSNMPTRQNILEGMKWLVSGAQSGDHLFFHYSGHGTSVKDVDGDEGKDGKDEAICPVDYANAGLILDDDMHRILVESLPEGCSLVVVFDCCHSGTILDLPFVYQPGADGKISLMSYLQKARAIADQSRTLFNKSASVDRKLDAAKKIFGEVKGFLNNLKGNDAPRDANGLVAENNKKGGAVFAFAGCKDDQTSADARISGSFTGALSHALIKTMTEQPNQTFEQVLINTRTILHGQYSQIPQLCVGTQIDLKQQFMF